MIDLSLQLLNYSIGIYDYTIWCRLAPYWARYLRLNYSVIIVIWKLGFDDLLALLFTLCHCRISLIHSAVVAAWILSRSKWGASQTFLRYLGLCATISCFQVGIDWISGEPDFQGLLTRNRVGLHLRCLVIVHAGNFRRRRWTLCSSVNEASFRNTAGVLAYWSASLSCYSDISTWFSVAIEDGDSTPDVSSISTCCRRFFRTF